MTSYVVISNFAAFLGGMFLMRVLMRLGFNITDRVPDHFEPHDPAPPKEAAVQKRKHVTVAIVGLAVSLLIFGLGIRTGYELLKDQYGCVNNYANDLADSLEPRQAASETYQERQVDVFDATEQLLSPGGGRDGSDLRDALREYRLARTELLNQRMSNPYPDPPREVC